MGRCCHTLVLGATFKIKIGIDGTFQRKYLKFPNENGLGVSLMMLSIKFNYFGPFVSKITILA